MPVDSHPIIQSRMLPVDQRQLDVLLSFVFFRSADPVLEVPERVGEEAFPEVFVYIASVSALGLNQVAGDVEEAPDLEGEVDEAEGSDAEGVDEGADGDAVDEDEDPEQGRTQPDVVHDLGEDEEGAGSVAQAEADHLDEDEDHCEDVQTGHEDLDERDQQQGDQYYPLSLHHEGSSSVFLQELAREQSHYYLQQVQVHVH